MLVFWKITLMFKLHPRASFTSKEILQIERERNGIVAKERLLRLVQTKDR